MTASSSDYELLTEHLGYSPVSLLDDIINTVNVLADRALDSVERLLLSIPPQNLGFTAPKPAKDADPQPEASSAEDVAKLEIENGTHQLETVLNAAIDKNFDIFELYVMRNVLTVSPADRPFVRLSHYHGLDFAENSGGGHHPTPESVNALRRRLRASQKLHVALETERARNDALLRRLRGLVGVPDPHGVKAEEGEETPQSAFGFLRHTAGLEQGAVEAPLTTTTEFTLSQLHALRSLSTSLRTILPDLQTSEPPEEDGGSGEKKSWRRERVEYVEGASRKYLETAGGLELGDRGEVRDGEWQGEGRRLARGEVEGLEKVVAILGRSEGSGERAQEVAGEAMDES